MSDSEKITREHLEDKFQAFQQDLQGKVADKKGSLKTIASVAGFVVVLLAYATGRRGGRKRRSVVEIRRG